jgi:hypothetical protein
MPIVAGFAAWCGVASACGVCVEDKIAAVYDHAVVTRALASGRMVVFAEVRGAPNGGAIERLANAARRTRGVDRETVRTSVEPGALSFALDAMAQEPRDAVASVARQAGATLTLLRVVDQRAGPPR